jgi:hypothetical protein
MRRPNTNRVTIVCEVGCQIFRQVRNIALWNYISYAGPRISLESTADILPEMTPFLRQFRRNSLARWVHKLERINRRLQRIGGVKLGLVENLNITSFPSLDDYMLLLHSDKLSSCFEALVSFGEKVAPLISSHPRNRIWHINDYVLIQRRHWKTLARYVMNLLQLLRVADPDTCTGSCINESGRPSSWPDQDRLQSAMRRAGEIYGCFGEANIDVPLVLGHLVPSFERDRRIIDSTRPS